MTTTIDTKEEPELAAAEKIKREWGAMPNPETVAAKVRGYEGPAGLLATLDYRVQNLTNKAGRQEGQVVARRRCQRLPGELMAGRTIRMRGSAYGPDNKR
jgi:hypothetical protein